MPGDLGQELGDLRTNGGQGRGDLTTAVDAFPAGAALEELHVEHPPGTPRSAIETQRRLGKNEARMIGQAQDVGKVDQVVAWRPEAMHEHHDWAVSAAQAVVAAGDVG